MSLEAHSHHEEPRHTGHKWLDISIAVCALVVSITSVVLTMVHGQTMEKMADANARLVDANSWPFIAYSTGNVGPDPASPQIDMRVSNDGVGPAKIETMALTWQGVAYPDAPRFLAACCGYQPMPNDGLQMDVVAGRVLRAGETIPFLIMPKATGNAATYGRLNAARSSGDLKLDLCYCSVFDDCWSNDIATYSLKPVKIASCERPAVPYEVPAPLK